MQLKTLLMIGFIPIGVYFCISLDIFVLGTANVTEKIENSVTNTPNNLNTSIPEKNLKIAFLTDGLFSDAGWGAFGYNAAQALQEKICLCGGSQRKCAYFNDRKYIERICRGRL